MDKSVVVVSDLDGTLTTQESSWQYVLENLNLWHNQGKNNLEKFLKKQIDYDEFIKLDVELLKGTTIGKYLSIINNISLRNGLNDLFIYLKNINSKNIIVSSGLKDVVDRISTIIDIHEFFVNEIHNDGHILNGSYTKNVGWHEKEKIMKLIKQDNPNSFIIAFGDTSADLALFKYANLKFSCFSKASDLIAKADYNINDLCRARIIIESILGT